MSDDPSLPALEEVAALVGSRTKAPFAELGTFNADTKPTDVQVNVLIARSARQVYSRVGAYQRIPPVPDDGGVDLQATAVDLVALRASLWVELSYFPEQVKGDRSPYAQLLEAWKDDLAALVESVQEATANPEGPQAGDDVGPVFGFRPAGAGEILRAPGCETPDLPWGWDVGRWL